MNGTSSGFVDCHCHVLPGVDDGPPDLKAALDLVRLAAANGTSVLAATSHLYAPYFDERSPAELASTFEELRAALAARADVEPALASIELVLGAEHYVDSFFFEALEDKRVLPLAGTRHLLVEFFPGLPAHAFRGALERIADAGFVPVLAHVERYPALAAEPALIAELKGDGVVIQVNAEAIRTPRWGRKRPVDHLLHGGLVDFIASDGHDPVRRPPNLAGAAAILEQSFSAVHVDRWLRQRPRALLAAVDDDG